MGHTTEQVASTIAERSDTRNKYGAVVTPGQGDHFISTTEMKDLYQLTKEGGQGLSAEEYRVARLADVFAKVLTPSTAATPKLTVGAPLTAASEPAWRKSVSIASISGQIVQGQTGSIRADARQLAQRIAGPTARTLSPADFAKAVPWLTQVDRVCAQELFRQLYFSKPFDLPAQAGTTPKGRAFTIEQRMVATPNFPIYSVDRFAPRYNTVSESSFTMPVERGVMAVDLTTGQVFEPVNGVVSIAVPANGQLSLALMRTTGYRMVLERFDVQAPPRFTRDALV